MKSPVESINKDGPVANGYSKKSPIQPIMSNGPRRGMEPVPRDGPIESSDYPTLTV